MVTFLELFGVGKVEHLNALTRWKDNDPTKSLEAAVGVDTLGEVFKLDLHEKFHGPHGLVAGMTGSGKSEFIIAYILSLAVNYHPNEVAFILIDYKGGGMAKSFENLPHTAGIITNLDGAAIKRSLISIESELKRRQAIFAQASKQVGESNIDIYNYQKLYREGVVAEPLQHLFIISDEFAELKTQQPEFMAQLVSAARIGRSLGVHLILATQKPSGVVDDQIWSNSKFRVSLKVQERADSMDMLKRPDAAELTDTGRFYLQVGYNELFEMGQSAWAGHLIIL
jgi:S-DNA-T family DNA segregation ATPase FtsK/SpoIIIE